MRAWLRGSGWIDLVISRSAWVQAGLKIIRRGHPSLDDFRHPVEGV